MLCKKFYDKRHENWEQEVRAYRAFANGHPNIASPCDIDLPTKSIFFNYDARFSDLLGLIEHYRINGYLNASTTWELQRQLCEAVAYLHSFDVAHRDIKPDNIVARVDADLPHLILIDFSLALTPDQMVPTSDGLKCSSKCGSTAYISPEYFDPSLQSPFCIDWWAIGLTCFVMWYYFMLVQDIEYDINGKMIRTKNGEEMRYFYEHAKENHSLLTRYVMATATFSRRIQRWCCRPTHTHPAWKFLHDCLMFEPHRRVHALNWRPTLHWSRLRAHALHVGSMALQSRRTASTSAATRKRNADDAAFDARAVTPSPSTDTEDSSDDIFVME